MISVRCCPVCGQSAHRDRYRPRGSPGPVAECQHCGMVYIHTLEDCQALIFDGPVLREGPDIQLLTSADLTDIRHTWEFSLFPDREAEGPALRQNAVDSLHKIETRIAKPLAECNLLDFGSGWGFFLAAAKERGWNTFGLEPLPASAVYARAVFGLDVITDTLHEDTFPPDFFDAIVAIQVFEHLPHPEADIQMLYKMLRKEGILLIEVPNVDTWTLRMLKSHHRHFAQDHLNFFSIDTLSQFLNHYGFEVIDQYHPIRRMSIRYLTRCWLRRYLPSALSDRLQAALQRTPLWERCIGLNIGDIIAVIGQKI